MRPLVLSVFFLAVAACDPDYQSNPPPGDRLYYPSGLVHAPGANGSDGFLFVASSNFDKRFDFGAVLPIDLSRVGGPEGGLPPFDPAAPLPELPRALPDLAIPENAPVYVQSFAGQMARYPLPDGTSRLLVPSWAEGHHVQAIDARGAELTCFSPSAGSPRNCIEGSLSLVENEKAESEEGKGLPRAPEPFGVDVDAATGDAFVTHIRSADTPPGTGREFRTYVVKLSAGNPLEAQYIPLGVGPTHGVAIGSRYAYVTGRFVRPFAFMVRLVARDGSKVIEPRLEDEFHVLEARGTALRETSVQTLGPAGQVVQGFRGRLFIAGRGPSSLVIADVNGADPENPTLEVVRSVLLPEGANEVKLLPRAGRGDLVLVTCTGSDSLAIYDDDLGQVVTHVRGVGNQPFQLATLTRGAGARVFVSNFGDGRVAVVDIPNVADPQNARVVAHLGESQICLVNSRDPSCDGAQP